MIRIRLGLIVVALLVGNAPSRAGQAHAHCVHPQPPSIWISKSSFPFQAGAEATFDELYHGPWRTERALTLYVKPRSAQVAGRVSKGVVVQALVGETIVVSPMRMVAAQDFQVVTSSGSETVAMTTMHKGDAFWVLESGNEGTFNIWWHCGVVGWDSTEATAGDQDQLERLGTNQEGWVRLRVRRGGLSGWFKYDDSQGAPLVPALPTTKRAG